MERIDLTAFLTSDSRSPEPNTSDTTRTQMRSLLHGSFGPLGGPQGASSSLRRNQQYAIPSVQFPPAVFALISEIIRDLDSNLRVLLNLNPSRREAVAQHLDRLAGITPGPTNGDIAGGLRRWVEGPRSPAQNSALQGFFEEIALMTLGQALILKAWSERGLRKFKEEDIGRLNFELGSSLKPHIPLDRESWQITRPNLYSWYTPSPAIQREIWNVVNLFNLKEETPSFLAAVLKGARQHVAQHNTELAEVEGYDPRFFNTIWENIHALGLDTSTKRRRAFFSLTLRDGAIVHSCTIAKEWVNWIGVESHPFELLSSEMIQLWWGPGAPPLWAAGTGLEVHSRDQISLGLQGSNNCSSAKPSLFNRIAEMEACDFAWLLEERTLRANSRTPEAARLKQTLESLPYFKKIKGAGTSLGDLQACVSITKLRPGGLLLWAREEPLSEADGMQALGFLLDHAKLVCEWDFSQTEHSLPVRAPLFPKYLYLFSREPDAQVRRAHKPTRISIQGPIRSHVEVPLILGDALQSLSRPVAIHGQWKIHAQKSTSPQQDWSENWPTSATNSALITLEALRTSSLPLAGTTTIRPTPAGDSTRGNTWSFPSVIAQQHKGFWIHASATGIDRKVITCSLPTTEDPATGSGFLVMVPEMSWIAPLRAYLESETVKMWLDHHAERRADKWILSEAVVKFIPIPKRILSALGYKTDLENTVAAPKDLLEEITLRPKHAKERLANFDSSIRAEVMVHAAWALNELRTSQAKLLSMVTPEGQIQWKKLLNILPKSECVPLTQHPQVKFIGHLPPHTPIGTIEKVKAPAAAIFLMTETGFNLRLVCENAMLLEMIHEQVRGLKHPTWHEITSLVSLPRRLEVAETAATDILRSHGEQSLRLRDLLDLVSACLNH